MTDTQAKSDTNAGPIINVAEIYELNLWSRKFGVTPFALKEAVRKVGPHANDVEEHLNRLK